MSVNSEKLFNAIIDEYVASGCPGVILEIRTGGDKLIFTGTSGLFSRGESRQITVNDAFRAASITKTVTAATAVCMAADRFWKLDDPVADYLPQNTFDLLSDFAGLDNLYELTIRRLLNHTSGIPDYFFNPRFRILVESKPDHIWEPWEIIEFALDNGGLLFTPGKKFSYGDTGYVLAGMAVENILDCSLSEAYRAYIFEPLEMGSSYLEWREDSKPVDLSHHYEGEKDLHDANLSFDWAGGGLITTAADLSRLLYGIFHEKLFDKRWLSEMTDFYKDTTWNVSGSARYVKYGLGIGTNLADGEEIIGSTGVWGAFAYFWPSGDTTICGTLNLVCADRNTFMESVIKTLKTVR